MPQIRDLSNSPNALPNGKSLDFQLLQFFQEIAADPNQSQINRKTFQLFCDRKIKEFYGY